MRDPLRLLVSSLFGVTAATTAGAARLVVDLTWADDPSLWERLIGFGLMGVTWFAAICAIVALWFDPDRR